MKYWSEKLEKLFDTVEELKAEENAYEKKTKEKELLEQQIKDAKENYFKLKEEYDKKYGEENMETRYFPFSFVLR